MIPFPMWSLEWWSFVALGTIAAVAVLWWLASRSLLLQQILWPPIIEGGHHTSKRYKAVTDAHRKRTSGRCVICGCHGDRTWHLFSIERKGWGFRIIAARSTARKNAVHELLYSWVRSDRPVPRRWLKNICTTHHTKLHRFDKWLFPNDQRNRWLWLSSFIVIGGYWALYGSIVGGLTLAGLWRLRPDLTQRIVTVVASAVR